MQEEVKHYKVKSLPTQLRPNSVYYVKATSQSAVNTYITDQNGFPFPLLDLTGGGNVGVIQSVTGTGVTGTFSNPIINISTFKSSDSGNLIEISSNDGKLFVKPITSPDGSIDIVSTASALELQLGVSLQTQIQNALQPGDNVSELINDAGYLTQDNVVEYANLAAFPVTGVIGTIYIAIDTGLFYSWNGTTYVPSSAPITGITGVGTTNYLPKFTSPTTIGNSVHTTTSQALVINDSGRGFIDFATTRLSIQRAQSQIDFNCGNPGFSQPSFIVSDNQIDGFELRSKGELALKTGATYANEGLRVFSTGKLKFTQTPDTGATSDFLLMRDTSGNIKQIAGNTYVTTANLTLQNAYNNSTDGKIILDATRGDVKVKSIAGITKAMSFFDPLDNEVLTFHSESGGPNIKRITANNNGFYVDSGSNIGGHNLTINDIYAIGDIVLSNNKTLTSYLNGLQTHYFKGISGVKWESNVKIEYAADYSASYSNRSLIDKGYADGRYYPIPTGTTAQYIDGTGAFQTFPTIPTTPSLQQTITVNKTADEIELLYAFFTGNAFTPALTPAPPFDLYVSAIKLAQNGGYYVYGNFNGYDGGASQGIVKILTNGSIDTSFVTGTGFNNYPYTGASLLEDDFGKIYISGAFNTYNSTPSSRIVKLNANGSIDTSFAIGSGFTGYSNGYTNQMDFNIAKTALYVTGLFFSYKGISSTSFAKVLINGDIDPSFIIGSGFNSATLSVAVNSDDTLFVTTYATTYKGAAIPNIIKLLPNGDRDFSFVSGTGFNTTFGPANYVLKTPDNKVIAVGDFTSYNGTASNRIIKLNQDGTVDTSFVVGTGFEGTPITNFVFVASIQLVDNNTKYLCRGIFTSFKGVPTNGTVLIDLVGNIIETYVNKYSASLYVNNALLTLAQSGININKLVFVKDDVEYLTLNQSLTFDKTNGKAEYNLSPNLVYEDLGENELVPKKFIIRSVAKTTSFTAVNSGIYNTNGTITVTDAVPETNQGYIVYVIGGTTTIGGVGYTTGSLVYRFFNGAAWTSTDMNSVGGITSVTATSPITSSGGTTPVISTSMSTNKLIGRSTAGTGVMEEITVGTGLSLSGGTLNASATGGISHATASGTDTYTATVSGVTAYNDADAYLIRFTNGNTTGATLNINSLGAIPLYRNNDGPLLGGDILAGGEMICIYNSTLVEFQVIGISPNSLIAYVTNDDSVTLTKGMPVYAFSGTGDRMTVKRANNSTDATSAQTVGLVLSTSIAANQKGVIMMQGLLDGLSTLPTANWADGDAVYLGATDGSITKVKPHAPNHLVYLGVVTTASPGAAGRMYVRVQNGYELDELHNVQAQTPTLKDTLWYDNTVTPAQWKTASIPTILGYTPVTNARTLTINGTAYDLTADRSWTITASGKSINTVSINTNAGSASSTDYVYLASGTINITLPTAVGNQNLYTIKNVGTGVITVDTTSSETIDGS